MRANIETMEPARNSRQLQALLGLVECYIENARPVGSNSLKERLFPGTSSATLRNYFVALEREGYLHQEHASSGRIPTAKAYAFYAARQLEALQTHPVNPTSPLKPQIDREEQKPKALSLFLQRMAHQLSRQCVSAIFISSPKFDRDTVLEVKIVPLDRTRCLAILLTAFGFVHTLILQIEGKVGLHFAANCERYFTNRLHNLDTPLSLTESEQSLADRLYDETMVRYVVESTANLEEDLYRTGYSQLLSLGGEGEQAELIRTLRLFEHPNALKMLLRECMAHRKERVWIGDDLSNAFESTECAVLAAPYSIHGKIAGGIGMLSSMRIPYLERLALLRDAALQTGSYLSELLQCHAISYRLPEIAMKSSLHDLALLTHIPHSEL